MMPDKKIIERRITRNQFIGIWNSGAFLFRVTCFAFFAIRRIRIPVSPPEMTPPTLRISVKPMKSNWVTMR